MSNFDYYLESAKKSLKISSNNQIARLAGISGASLSAFVTGKALPADETILKIANLAKIPPEKALIDVSIWRNKKNTQALKAWENLSKKLSLK